MTTSPDLTFQEVVYLTLTAAMPTARIEAHPPHNVALPFIRIGESYVADNEIGHEINIDVHAFSGAEGPHEAKNLMHSVRTALHEGTFSRDVWHFTCVREESARVYFDTNEEEWHGIQTFRCLASLL